MNTAQVQYGSEAVSGAISDTAQAMSNGVVVSLSSAWLGISTFKPARTEGAKKPLDNVSVSSVNDLNKFGTTNDVRRGIDPQLGNQNGNLGRESATPTAQRYERQHLYSLRLGEYFMPLSQTFNLRAKKRLNVCSLVDGVDIIQQTRHEAKTIDCSLRVTLRTNQPNLEVVSDTQRLAFDPYSGTAKPDDYTTELVRSLETFAQFLSDLYEDDAVFAIDNQVINDVFGVQYAMISEYNFRPQVSRSTFQFDFTLTEVKITSDTLTVDKTQMR
ncbi:MAG: hypothetical protein IIU75_04880 [Rikenellaceae bacterium]|nr:hypothetical protein [Alistipes sp.]MBQ5596393.1 hypothetical protein [Rikenellaceae bacterium]